MPVDPPAAPDVDVSLTDLVEQLLDGPRPLPIVRAGHPVLRTHTVPYAGELDEPLFAELIAAMHDAMHDAPGVGLAAPQVGLPIAVAVIEDSAQVPPDVAAAKQRYPVPFRVIVNPVYEPIGTETAAFFEGCLSVPGYQAVVARSRQVRLRCLDEAGRPIDEEVAGWHARIVAHETDHLNGTLYVDRADLRTLSAV
jgi:peptide deformylase